MIARATLLVLLIGLAGLSVWLAEQQREPPTPQSLVRGTDGYFEGLELRGSDARGRLAYRMSAERAEHDAERDAIVLSGVDVELLSEGTLIWTLVADTATAPAGSNHIELDGGVVMRKAGDDSDLAVSGESFMVSPDDETSSSEGPVRISMGDQVLDGIGFRADLAAGSMRLLSHVHGSYSDAG